MFVLVSIPLTQDTYACVCVASENHYDLALTLSALRVNGIKISPYNINALENRVVMRIEYMIREDESN